MNINPVNIYDSVGNGNKNNHSGRLSAKFSQTPSGEGQKDSISFKANKKTFLDWARNFDLATAIGNFKQKIETMGFVALFLIQDGLGMTVPRTWTGFNRDKEITGKFHIQEGLEVFGREGLTGPAMMAIPAGVFALTKLAMGKSTYINSRLIKSFGKTVTGMLEHGSFKDAEVLKSSIVENGFKKMYKETLGTDASADIISKAMTKLSTFNNVKDLKLPEKMNVQEIEKTFGLDYGIDAIRVITKNAELKPDSVFEGKELKKIVKHIKKDLSNPMNGIINEALLETRGADLSKLNRVLLDGNTYDTKIATEGLQAYAHDVAHKFKNPADLTTAKAEDFMYSMVGKRWTSNIAAGATVLAAMNYLPKLYAFGDKPPGEVSKCEAEHKTHKHDLHNHDNEKKGNVSFKGGFSAMGKKIAKWKDFWLAEGEFNKFNFSPTLMSGISIIGLTIPRGARAYERAPMKTEEQRQKEGWFDRLFKKDISEIKEIAIRDPLSALFVVFAVPLATRGIIKSYEKSSGFVLIDHAKDEGKGLKKLGKYLNPYSNISVINNAELDALYGGIDSHKKLVNVCEYLDRKGGNLARIFSYSKGEDVIFNDKDSFSLKSISKMSVADKNKKVLEYIRNANPELQTKMVDTLLPALKKLKNNRALGIAKTLSSIPFLLNLLIVSPFLLGVTIPKYTYKLTRKASDQAKGIPEPKGPAQPPNREMYLKKQAEDNSKVKQTA